MVVSVFHILAGVLAVLKLTLYGFLFCVCIGCGDSGGTVGDTNDPAATTDAEAMTETDENAGNPPSEE